MLGTGWRDARMKLERSLRSIAEEVGCSAPHLSDIEHGRRRPSRDLEEKLRATLQLPPAPPPPDNPSCVVCEGKLEARVVQHHAIDDPHGIIGPGYVPLRRAFTESAGFTCPRCGLHYDKRPAL